MSLFVDARLLLSHQALLSFTGAMNVVDKPNRAASKI
jgi:hypothetical protein